MDSRTGKYYRILLLGSLIWEDTETQTHWLFQDYTVEPRPHPCSSVYESRTSFPILGSIQKSFCLPSVSETIKWITLVIYKV